MGPEIFGFESPTKPMTGHKDGFVFFFLLLRSEIDLPWKINQIINKYLLKTNHHPHCYQLQQTFIYVGNTHIGASLVAQIVKNPLAMWETWVGSMGWEDLLEEGMEIHSSILAWRIPWTDEPGGLQAMRSQKVRHDSGIKHSTQHTHYPYMG